MIGKEIISEKYTTIAHAAEIMDERADFDELSYEHGCSLDYLRKFSTISKEDADAMFEQLTNLGLTEKMAVKIIDLLPETEEDLKIIFYRVDVPENKDDILEVVSKFK